MSDVVHWLVTHPQRWVIPAIFLAAVLGLSLALWRERRRSQRP